MKTTPLADLRDPTRPLPVTAEELGRVYAQAKRRYDVDPVFAAAAHAVVLELQATGHLNGDNSGVDAATDAHHAAAVAVGGANSPSPSLSLSAAAAAAEAEAEEGSVRHSWKVVCEVSRRSFQELFARLGLRGRLVELGESSYVIRDPVVSSISLLIIIKNGEGRVGTGTTLVVGGFMHT